MNPTFKKIYPHVIALFVFFIITLVYFKPYVFDGMVLGQQDLELANGMQGEIRKMQAESGEIPLWTNAMFSGMPAYQILYYTANPLKHVFKAFLLGHAMSPPWPPIFLMMAGFYLLMIVMKVDWRIALFGGLSFGLATNHIILVEAGHMTKLVASAYMAPILAGVILVLRNRYILGGALIALFVAMQVTANHVQITYYWVIILALFGLITMIERLRKGEDMAVFAKAAGVIILAGFLGIASNAGRLLTTYEYSKESIRGISELTKKDTNGGTNTTTKNDGLDYEYGFTYSYGVAESFNMMIPAYRGGSSGKGLADVDDSAVLKYMRNPANRQVLSQMDPQTQQIVLGRLPVEYWGEQPPTSGGVYFGAIIFLLFFVGLFLVNSSLRWWAIVGVVLTIMLAWGKNFAGFNYLVFDYFPMYNKFRAQTMILGITNLLVAIVAFRGLQAFFQEQTTPEMRKGALIKGGGVMLAFVGIAALLAMGEDFLSSQNEAILAQLPANIGNPLGDAIAADRASLLWGDLFRTIAFAGAAFGLLWFAGMNKMRASWAVIAIGLLTIFDLWGVDKRYLDYERFQSKQAQVDRAKPTEADKQTMRDKDPHYRVFDMRDQVQGPFQNSLTSIHHKSIGGYHAAKLMRYKELIERYLGRGISQQNLHIFNMLNMKYFITPDGKVQQNPEANGNAWFVKNIRIVENPDAEMDALATLKPKEEVVIAKKYATGLEDFNLQYDSTATINLTAYHPDKMTYKYSAKTPQLAVFSEVYYPEDKGWHLYVDGERLEGMTKANFILRAAKLPAGEHELVMAFEPGTYKTGELISVLSGILVLLLTIFGLYLLFKNNRVEDPERLPVPEEEVPAVRKAPAKKTVSKRKKKK